MRSFTFSKIAVGEFRQIWSQLTMMLGKEIGEPFAFWLVNNFLPPLDETSEEVQPMIDRHTFLTGTAIVMLIVLLGLLVCGRS